MERIRNRFKKIQKENPLLSTIVIFKRAVDGQRNLDKDVITEAFFELVDEKDYASHQTWDIIDHMLTYQRN